VFRKVDGVAQITIRALGSASILIRSDLLSRAAVPLAQHTVSCQALCILPGHTRYFSLPDRFAGLRARTVPAAATDVGRSTRPISG
jgi:hypothetical protein